MTPSHALVLTGALLPGVDAERVWPDLATRLRIDLPRLRDDVLARAPVAIKESDDLARLEQLRDEILAAGAEASIHPLDATGNLFALIDNVARGPLPRRFIADRVQRGVWPASVRVAAVGSREWGPFDAIAPATTLPPPPPVYPAAPVQRSGDGALLPAGAAIHAGFWRRSAAYLIDQMILLIPSIIVGIVPLLGLLAIITGQWLYFSLMESSPAQATLGKQAMGIKATDNHGRRLGFGQASGRYFGGSLSVMTAYIGYMLAGWTERKQALHDLVAGTCVVFRDVESGQPVTRARPPMPWYGWLVNILLMSVFPISILAAVSIPAYHEYVTRSKVVAASSSLGTLRIEIAEARAEGDACPQGSRDTGNPLLASVVFAGEAPRCSITATFAETDDVPANVRGQTLEWTYADDERWECLTTLVGKLAPRECR